MGVIYSLDSRCQNILQMIMNTKGYLTVKEIAQENHVSKRSVYYDITKINEWLDCFGVNPIEVERNKGVQVTSRHAKDIKRVLHGASNDIDYLFTPTQRAQIIVCSITKKSKPLFIEDFMSLCDVSRNTIISDLKVVSHNVKKSSLELLYENKDGYCIVGDFIRKISLFFLYFNSISEYYRKGIIPLDNKEKIYEIDEKLNRIEAELNTKYVSGILFALATFFASIDAQLEKLHFSENDRKDIMNTKEYQLVIKYFGYLQENDQLYLALYLLGSRLQTVPINLMIDNEDTTYELANSLVNEFSNIACVDFINKEAVVNALFAHLKTSLYRYKYGIQLANPMLADIKQEYNELFEITKKSCKVLQAWLGVPIPECEIAYITLHFGGFIVQHKDVKNELRILIICPNGVSTGSMLKAEIHTLIPHSTITNIMLSEFYKNHGYDIVISTVDIEGEVDVLMVHPILTDNDRVTILRRCMSDRNENKVELEEIVNIAKKYLTEKDAIDFRGGLEDYFNTLPTITKTPKNNFGRSMQSYLGFDTIQICNIDYNWQEAIMYASTPLLNTRCIKESYVDSIVKKCNELGPYMFIIDNVVLAHAGINDGVHKLGFCLTKFNSPIRFNTQRKADIILVLATKDQVSHICILHDIMTVFSETKNIEKIIQCSTKEEILTVIETVLKKEKNDK